MALILLFRDIKAIGKVLTSNNVSSEQIFKEKLTITLYEKLNIL